MPRPSPQTDRVVAVIELLSSGDEGATMTEIARHLSINPATCVHVMAALTSAGIVVREPDRRYHLGPALALPGRLAERRYPLLVAARSEMVALSERFGAACFAFAPDGERARLAQVTWPRDETIDRSQVRVGESVPMVPPLGLLFVAWGDDHGFDDWLARSPDASAHDQGVEARREALDLGYVVELAPHFTETSELAEVLDDRESPYRDGRLHRMLSAKGDGDHVASIGAPVFGPDGAAALSITLVTYWSTMTTPQVAAVGDAVRAAADRVTAQVARRPSGRVASS